MAPTLERSTATCASCDGGGGGTAGFHPRIAPSSLANRNSAGPDAVPLVTTKLVVPLKTAPVGPPPTWTSSATFAPAAVYSVDRSVPLSATHQGVVGPAVRPQALTRFGSMVSAGLAPSETR